MIVNNSRLATYAQCPRRYYWSYVHEGNGIVRRAVHEALAFGTIVHHLLAYYYSEQEWRTELDWALRAAVPDYDQFPELEKSLWQEKLNWAERLVSEYVKWAQTNDKFSVMEVESEGIVPLGQICYTCGRPFEASEGLGGDDKNSLPPACAKCHAEIHYVVYKTDLIVNEGGNVFPVDHKTTSGLGDAYLASWAYSPQMYLYLKGTRRQHPTANRFQMNFLRKAKLVGTMKDRQCKSCHNGSRKRVGCTACGGNGKVEVPAVQPPPFHRPPPVIMDPAVMDRVEISRIDAANSIQAEGDPEGKPLTRWRMMPDKCFDKGRCPYIDLCWSPAPANRWFKPAEDLTDGYLPRPKDYVTLAREEQT